MGVTREPVPFDWHLAVVQHAADTSAVRALRRVNAYAERSLWERAGADALRAHLSMEVGGTA